MADIRTISIKDREYPALLKEIPDAPGILYVRGAFPPPAPTLAVVGTRRLTRYGKEQTERIAQELVRAGIIVVSGLARGIDTIGHKAAVEAGMPTIAVLGTGIDDSTVFPQQNVKLAHEILDKGGCLVSEYPPGTHGTKYTFPARNRIIAGLSLGTLVMEAPIKSGALITGRLALDYNREVFAIPHPLGCWTGEGCNDILHQGAHLIRETKDILNVMGFVSEESPAATYKPENKIEEKLLACLSAEPLHIDKIIEKSEENHSAAMTALSMLEIKGIVKNVGEMNFLIK